MGYVGTWKTASAAAAALRARVDSLTARLEVTRGKRRPYGLAIVDGEVPAMRTALLMKVQQADGSLDVEQTIAKSPRWAEAIRAALAEGVVAGRVRAAAEAIAARGPTPPPEVAEDGLVAEVVEGVKQIDNPPRSLAGLASRQERQRVIDAAAARGKKPAVAEADVGVIVAGIPKV